MNKITVEICTQVAKLMDETISHYRELMRFEVEKLKLISSDNVDELMLSLSKEQALVMKSTSLENKRIKLFSELGIANITLTELVENSPNESKVQMKTLHKDFTELVNEVKRINDNISEIAKEKLKHVNEYLSRSGTASSQGLYTGSGKKTGGNSPSEPFRKA